MSRTFFSCGDPLTGILHAKKAPISIGTDVEPAVGSDLFTCMRLTLQHERNRGIIEALAKTSSRPQNSALTCRDALSWVTTGAAKIAGLNSSAKYSGDSPAASTYLTCPSTSTGTSTDMIGAPPAVDSTTPEICTSPDNMHGSTARRAAFFR